MKCEICGNEIPEGAQYCPFCGDPVFDVDITKEDLALVTEASENIDNNGNKEKDDKENNLQHELHENLEKADNHEKEIHKKGIRRKAVVIGAALLVVMLFLINFFTEVECFYSKLEITKGKNAYEAGENTQITFYEGTFFASNGRYLQNTFTRKEEIKEISYDLEHTRAAFLRGEECYYIDSGLKPKCLASKSDGVVMSKNGAFVYFNDLENNCVSMYDAENDETVAVSEKGNISKSSVSYDGKMLALYRAEDKSISIVSSGRTKPVRIVSGTMNLKALAVSDDGKRAFYSTYDGDNYTYYFYDDGKSTTVATGYYLRECINLNVTELVAFYYGLIYYNSSMENGVSITEDTVLSAIVRGNATSRSDSKSNTTYYVDVSSFEPFIYKDLESNVMYVYDHSLSPKQLEYVGLASAKIRLIKPELDSFICFNDDRQLCKISLDNCEIKEEPIDIIDDEEVYNFSYNDNMSVIWASTIKGNLYLKKDNQSILALEAVKNDLYYDENTQRTYFIKGQDLYSALDSVESIRLEKNGCKRFPSISNNDDYLEYIGTDDQRYLYIFGNFVKEN